MEEEATGSTESQWDIGALIHAVSGVSAIVLGGLMYSKAWAQGLFSLLMGIAAVIPEVLHDIPREGIVVVEHEDHWKLLGL